MKTEISPSARISPSLKIGNSVKIGHFTVVKDDVVIEDDVVIGDNVYIGDNAHIGRGARISDYCRIGENVRIGNDAVTGFHCIIKDGAHIGHGVILKPNTQINPSTHWTFAPTQIAGSMHKCWHSGPGRISIGCKNHTIEYWLRNYRKIGEQHGYTDEQIEEYRCYIELIAEEDKRRFGGNDTQGR
jgi:UDP-3-O-[3-hydroxymyristoyl] glucosamine N-acyltransferase